MKKKIRLVMTIIQYALIVIGVAAIATLVIPLLLGYTPFVVQSGSMEPTVKTGAVAYNNTHVDAKDVKQNDIIVFKQGESYVTHRVVRINDDNTFTTKGDANETEDLVPVGFKDFKGINAFSIPYLGYVLKIVQTKLGVFILVLITGLNIVYFVFTDDENDKNNVDDESNQKKNK